MADEAREASLPDEDFFQDTGGGRGPVPRRAPQMVENGNWGVAIDLASDPLQILGDLPGLRADLAKLNDINARNSIEQMRERMRAAGMETVPNFQYGATGGYDYGATVDLLQRHYEGFVQDRRLRDTWGADYQSMRIGRSRMTVQEFERRVLTLQQDAIDRAYDLGRAEIAAGRLPINGSINRTLGNFIDDRVRGELREFGLTEGINENQDSRILAVNRRLNNGTDLGYGIPDLRVGRNMYPDTTLANKGPGTRQLRLWNDIREGLFLVMRPTQLGGSSVFSGRDMRPVGRSPRGI